MSTISSNYIKLEGKLWGKPSWRTEKRVVLLIDEIDKADIEFPNDLLLELDRMRVLRPTRPTRRPSWRGSVPPIIMLTSNNEKELPDAFLRRCVFHFIDFPEEELMRRIVGVHHPDLDANLLRQALSVFYELRKLTRLRKRPSTSELIDWIAALRAAGVTGVQMEKTLPFLGALLKKEQDLAAFGEFFTSSSGRTRWRPPGMR